MLGPRLEKPKKTCQVVTRTLKRNKTERFGGKDGSKPFSHVPEENFQS